MGNSHNFEFFLDYPWVKPSEIEETTCDDEIIVVKLTLDVRKARYNTKIPHQLDM
jgi:hypothetical protein